MTTGTLICPNCTGDVMTEPPYWHHWGRWYCSEECVRAAKAS